MKRFGSTDVHEGMLLDTQRCEAYRSAIRQVVRPGDVVADLGAGTGLLSFFAVEAGARRVYAIEMSSIAEVAARLIEANGFQDRITLVRRRSTRARLPERCDVILSETLSILGFESEHTIAFMSDARERLLKPGGRVIPQECWTLMMPVQSDQFGVGSLPGLLYGFDVSELRRRRYRRQALHLEVSGKRIVELADAVRRWHIDFRRESPVPSGEMFEFGTRREGRLDGFLGWFEATLCDGVVLSNSPRLPPTSWGQLYFPTLDQPVVHPGQRIRLHLDPGLIAGMPHWSYRVSVD